MASVHGRPVGCSQPGAVAPAAQGVKPSLAEVCLPFLPLSFLNLLSVHTVPSPNPYLITQLHGLKILLAAVIRPELSKMQI